MLLDEGLVADLLPGSDARRIAVQGPSFARADAVVGGALAREAHRHVGIAFAGAEAVADADDENVANLERLARHLDAADLEP